MIKIFCDGPCGRELSSNVITGMPSNHPKVCLTVERVDGLYSGGIPSGSGRKHHFCLDCAKTAFAALKVSEK